MSYRSYLLLLRYTFVFLSLPPSTHPPLPCSQASATVAIPKEHHRFVIGKNGEKLQELELRTATKIAIPRPDDPSLNIRITGTKEGIEKARHEILLISAEQVRGDQGSKGKMMMMMTETLQL